MRQNEIKSSNCINNYETDENKMKKRMAASIFDETGWMWSNRCQRNK